VYGEVLNVCAEYSCPELFLEEPLYSSRGDFWGVGVVCYHLLFGYNPFARDTVDDTVQCILDESFAVVVPDVCYCWFLDVCYCCCSGCVLLLLFRMWVTVVVPDVCYCWFSGCVFVWLCMLVVVVVVSKW